MFSLVELARNPHVLAKVEHEVREKLGCKPVIEADDLPSLEYISWVFKETLRLWPAVPSVNRFINEDLTIRGHFIPKNTEISVIDFFFINLKLLSLINSFSYSFQRLPFIMIPTCIPIRTNLDQNDSK